MTPVGSGYLKQTGWAQTMTERRQLQHDRNYFLCGFVLVLSCFWGLKMMIVGVKSLVGKESWSFFHVEIFLRMGISHKYRRHLNK